MASKKVIGRHIYGELYGCDPAVLMNEARLVDIVKTAIEIGGFTLLDIKAWKISPGVSVIAVILESHVSVHTWPEYNFATVDVYTCGSKGDPVKAYQHIVKELKASSFTMKMTSRDYEEP